MKTLEYQIKNILDYPRIKELFKMQCYYCNNEGVDVFYNVRDTLETEFHDTFYIEVENLQRKYKVYSNKDKMEIAKYDIGEILVGDYTSLKITEIDWICDWNKDLGFKRIYKWNEVAEFGERPPF